MSHARQRKPKVGLRLCVRVLLILAAPLLAFALFGGVSQAANHTVLMKDIKFQSAEGTQGGTSISIAVGDSVEWVDQDATSHNVAMLDAPQSNVSPEIF